MATKGILFYSEHSPNSIQTISLLNKWNITSVGLVSVDNEKVRSFVDNSSEIHFKTLPALAILYNGSMVILEKEKLANWIAAVIEEIVRKNPKPILSQGGFVSLIPSYEPPQEYEEYETYPEYEDSPYTLNEESDDDGGIQFTFPTKAGDSGNGERNYRKSKGKTTARRKVNVKKVMAMASGEDYEEDEEDGNYREDEVYDKSAIKDRSSRGKGIKFQFPHEDQRDEEDNRDEEEDDDRDEEDHREEEYDDEEEEYEEDKRRKDKRRKDEDDKPKSRDEQYAIDNLPINKSAKGKGMKFQFKKGEAAVPAASHSAVKPPPKRKKPPPRSPSPPPQPKKRTVYVSDSESDDETDILDHPPPPPRPPPPDDDSDFDLDSETEESYPSGGGGRIKADTVSSTPKGKVAKSKK